VKPVRLEPEARLELRQAARWYEERGLVARLLEEVDAAIVSIGALPRRFPRVPGVDPSLEVRRCLLRSFPYALVFLVTPDELLVIAIAHVRREPGYWLYRVEREDE